MREKIHTIFEYFLGNLLILMSVVAFSQLNIYRLGLIFSIALADLVLDICLLKQPFGILGFGFLGCIACGIGPKNTVLTFTVCFLECYFLSAQCAVKRTEIQNDMVYFNLGVLNRFDVIQNEKPSQVVIAMGRDCAYREGNIRTMSNCFDTLEPQKFRRASI